MITEVFISLKPTNYLQSFVHFFLNYTMGLNKNDHSIARKSIAGIFIECLCSESDNGEGADFIH